jgi:hypothetical protein
MAAQAATGVTNEAGSDLAQLWRAAVEDYEKKTGKSLRLDQFRSMDAVMNGTESLSNKFKDFRDDKSKLAKVRTALKNNMWLIQKIVNAVQTVGGAAAVRFEINETKTCRCLSSEGLPPGYASQLDLYGFWAGNAGMVF